MCIRRETREKARQSLAFSRVSKPHTHITHMLRQCTSIVYIDDIILLMLKLASNTIGTFLTSLGRHERDLSTVFRGILPIFRLFSKKLK